MRLLLDTHLRLWALADSRRLGKAALALIDRGDIYVSAASVWGISIKAAIGKLKADPEIILKGVEPAGFSLLPVSGEHAARVYQLAPVHHDPFDRLLIAQAQIGKLRLYCPCSAA